MSSNLSDATCYMLAGLQIVSELPLEGLLLPGTLRPHEDVRIKVAAVSEKLANAFVAGDGIAFDGSSLLLSIDEIARFLVRDGREIIVDPLPHSDRNDVRAFLLGSVFGSLCHQRGLLPLHSSALDLEDGCAAFVGESGAGKSTIAAAMSKRGHQVIADDVSYVAYDGLNQVVAWPGIGRIRLWEDAVVALGYNKAEVVREFRGYNKYLVPLHSTTYRSRPRRLSRIYSLSTVPSKKPPTIERLHGALALEALMHSVYGMEYAECMGLKPAVFTFCASIARQVPVYRFSRPIDYDRLSNGLEFLESHLQSSSDQHAT